MAKTLDSNQAAFLAVLEMDDPNGEMWSASWRVGDMAKQFGADSLACTPLGAFAVAKELYRRKLLDKQSGRATELENGYSLNDDARQALANWRETHPEWAKEHPAPEAQK